jgi:hypothetical protein
MNGSSWLADRLAPYTVPSRALLGRHPFRCERRPGGLRARLEVQLDEAVRRFEIDRLLYDIEVDATSRWLDRLTAFDAYYAGRRAR